MIFFFFLHCFNLFLIFQKSLKCLKIRTKHEKSLEIKKVRVVFVILWFEVFLLLAILVFIGSKTLVC